MSKLRLKITILVFSLFCFLIVNHSSFAVKESKSVSLKMLWQTTVDPVNPQYPDTPLEYSDADTFVTSSDRIFLIRGGRLFALQNTNGRILWTVGNGLQGALIQEQARLFAQLGTNSVQSFSARDGKQLWKTQLPGKLIRSIAVMSGYCLVRVDGGGVILNASTGQVTSKFNEDYKENYGPVALIEGVVVWHWLLVGTTQFDILEGIDVKTGKKIWIRYSLFQKVDSNLLLVIDLPPGLGLDNQSEATIWIDPKNNREVKKQVFDISKIVNLPFGGAGVHLYLDDQFVWVYSLDAKGWFLVKFNRDNPNQTPIRYNIPEGIYSSNIISCECGFFLDRISGAAFGVLPGKLESVSYRNSDAPIGKVKVFGSKLVIVRQEVQKEVNNTFKADRTGAIQIVNLKDGKVLGETVSKLGDSISLSVQNGILFMRSGPFINVFKIP
jgi:PQQ-like domain